MNFEDPMEASARTEWPMNYFQPRSMQEFLLKRVADPADRQRLKYMVRVHDQPSGLVNVEPPVSGRALRMHRAMDPAFCGGNRLPPFRPGEVEVARVTLHDEQCEVICVYAEERDYAIHLRVVDERNGPDGPDVGNLQSESQLSLFDFTNFLFSASSLIERLRPPVGQDWFYATSRISAESDFYGGFAALCIDRVRNHYLQLDHEIGRLPVYQKPNVSCRAELYPEAVGAAVDASELVEAMARCPGLASFVESLYAELLCDLSSAADFALVGRIQSPIHAAALRRRLDALPEDVETGAIEWVLGLTDIEFELLVSVPVNQWLSDPPDEVVDQFGNIEHFPTWYF